jgi:phospholipid/cholesterol/gamma-HCH transport system substrate-binding protein
MSTTRRLVSIAVASAMLLTGCGFNGMHDLPLPGGADVGDSPYRVVVHFPDVLDLVQQAHVKVNDVAVGRVEDIAVADDGWSAEVTLLVNRNVRLPENSTARLVQSTLLGEKFVELVPPDRKPRGSLGDGDAIPLSATERYPEVEEVLGALSLLLNGGGVEQLRTIAREVNDALAGNETEIRQLLRNANHLVGTLDKQRGTIVTAIDALNRLARKLRKQSGTIDTTLTHLGPGVETLTQQRRQLTRMLTSLDKLSAVATNTIVRSRKDILADLKALDPTLRKLAQAGDDIPRTLEVLLTFPFTDDALGVIRGDYTNIDVRLDLNLDSVLGNFLGSSQPPMQPPDAVSPPADGGTGSLPGLPLPLTRPGGGLNDLVSGLLGGGR